MKIQIGIFFLLLSLGVCARAAIIYTDPPDQLFITNHLPFERTIDLDGDGTDDFLLRATTDHFKVVPLGSNRVLTTLPNPPDLGNWIIPHEFGSIIGDSASGEMMWSPRIDGPNGPIGGSLIACQAVGPGESGCIGTWFNLEAHVGLEFLIDDEIHYGWMRLDVRDFNGGWLRDFAYEETPGMAIHAGQVPEPATAALLAGIAALGVAIFIRRRRQR